MSTCALYVGVAVVHIWWHSTYSNTYLLKLVKVVFTQTEQILYQIYVVIITEDAT